MEVSFVNVGQVVVIREYAVIGHGLEVWHGSLLGCSVHLFYRVERKDRNAPRPHRYLFGAVS
jgi:hypothetical protein